MPAPRLVRIRTVVLIRMLAVAEGAGVLVEGIRFAVRCWLSGSGSCVCCLLPDIAFDGLQPGFLLIIRIYKGLGPI